MLLVLMAVPAPVDTEQMPTHFETFLEVHKNSTSLVFTLIKICISSLLAATCLSNIVTLKLALLGCFIF